MVRASFGCYNDTEDIERLIDMLKRIASGDYRGDYEVHPGSGDFIPKDYPERFSQYFLLVDEGDTGVGVHGPCGR
jgi:hypothetical protein